MNNVQQIANLATEYKKQFDAGKLSAADFKELIGNLNLMEQINSNSIALQSDIDTYNTLKTIWQFASSLSNI